MVYHYDRDAFLAGLAVGRALWRPKNWQPQQYRFAVLRRRNAVQARTTTQDLYEGTWNGHDQYGYCVMPDQIFFAYYQRSPYPGAVFISRTRADVYQGYPDGYEYTNKKTEITQVDAATGLYYRLGTANDGPTRLNPNTTLFDSARDALDAFYAQYGGGA